MLTHIYGSQDPKWKMRALFMPMLSLALLGSSGLSPVLGDLQVKEMRREMGVPKIIVKCLFSLTHVKQNELCWVPKFI